MSASPRTGAAAAPRRAAVQAIASLALLLATPLAVWAEPAGDPRPWLAIGVLAGSTQPDARLANYQWVTTPRASWGAQALAGKGRFATGLRVARASTTQAIDLPSGASRVSVHSTSVELLGQGRLVALWGMHVFATASGGRLHLGYAPDEVVIPASGSSGPTTVALAPIDEWVAGGGLVARRALSGRWSVGLEIERRVFALDTAHRNGSVIENSRESFGDWNARVELARLLTGR